MLEHYYKLERKIQELRRSNLVEILDEMAAVYHGWRMPYVSAIARLRAAFYFGEWMRGNAILPNEATREDTARFIDQFNPPHRKGKSNRCRFNCNFLAGVNMALKLLGQKYPPQSQPPSHIDREIEAYTEFLRQKRALADGSVRNHAFYVRPFLEAMFAGEPIRPARIDPENVQRYVLEQLRRYRLGTVRDGVSGKLRSLFNFWTLMGIDTRLLLAAIPKFRVPPRCLPHAIVADEDFDTLWSAFDRATALGRRDYAAIRCMADLGIRVGDVAILTLEDVNWRKGEIRVHNNKGGRPLWLPLPKALGEALADYALHGRPKNASRLIFLRHVAPHGAPRTTSMIRNAFRRALRRAGLHGKYSGTHTLRHSLATRLRRGRASVKDMADVLGHRSLQSTTIYAQVDQPALRSVAQPWPEGI